MAINKGPISDSTEQLVVDDDEAAAMLLTEAPAARAAPPPAEPVESAPLREQEGVRDAAREDRLVAESKQEPEADETDILAGGDGDEGELVVVRTRSGAGWWVSWIVVGVFVALGAAFLLLSLRESGAGAASLQDRYQAGFFAAVCMASALFVLTFTGGRYDGGFFKALVGSDGRASTSLTQIGLWTLLIGGGVAYLLGMTIFDSSRTVGSVLPDGVWDDYLILLGGPFSAGVLAKGIVTYKVRNGTLQKSEPQAASVKQLAQGDNGDADLVDAQYLIFNVIAMGYYVTQVVQDSSMPRIPEFLLVVTSGTAALYVANKAAARNAPTITSVSPVTVSPARLLTIYGTNFDPGDPTNLSRRITVSLVGYDQAICSDDSSDTEVTIRIPPDMPLGWTQVVVTSTAGVETSARDLKIVPRKPRRSGQASGQPPKRPGYEVKQPQRPTDEDHQRRVGAQPPGSPVRPRRRVAGA